MKAAASADVPDVPVERLVRREDRSKRQHPVRSLTVSMKRLSKRDREEHAIANPYPKNVERPKTRPECIDGERPCPFVSCRHHLALDVNPKTGAIKIQFPDLELDEMAETCSLDVADRGGHSLEAVGAIMNLTRERIRQFEFIAKRHYREAGGDEEMLPEDDDPREHALACADRYP